MMSKYIRTSVTKMSILNFIALLVIFFCIVHGGILKSDLYKLDMVHYNDFHARFEETSVSYPVCDSNDTMCLGGFARMYQEIMTLLKEKPGALLLNAGDTFQGTYWYTLMKWNITQKFINLLPNDVHTIGNHEFDDGINGLVPYLKALQAPVVVANIDTSEEPSLDGLYQPHIVIEKNGRKIGIIGLITTETKTSSNPGRVKFLDPIKTVQKEAKLLTDAGVDIIIVLSHCGLDVDKTIASTVGENIDVIVGGHSHSLLWNGTAPSKEYVSGPYPILLSTESQPDHKVLIVTASCFSKYLGNLTVYFDKKGDIVNFDGTSIFLNRSIPEDNVHSVGTVLFILTDPEIKALLQPYADEIHALTNEVVGYANENFLANLCGSEECEIGDFFADAFLDATKAMNMSTLPHVSFVLRNMIRGSIPKGEITRGQLINTMPFTKNVTTFAIPGRYIVDVFKVCMTNYWVARPFQGPWLPQVSGLRLTLNLTEDVDVKVLVKEDDEYLDLDPDKEYQVTTISFLTNGGNQFDMLHKYGRNKTIVGLDTDVLERYIKSLTPITPVLGKRLIVIN